MSKAGYLLLPRSLVGRNVSSNMRLPRPETLPCYARKALFQPTFNVASYRRLGCGDRDCESIMTLASPFVKGGSRGILLKNRSLIFNNNFLIDQISPSPSLLKRGKKDYFHILDREIPAIKAQTKTSRCKDNLD